MNIGILEKEINCEQISHSYKNVSMQRATFSWKYIEVPSGQEDLGQNDGRHRFASLDNNHSDNVFHFDEASNDREIENLLQETDLSPPRKSCHFSGGECSIQIDVS